MPPSGLVTVTVRAPSVAAGLMVIRARSAVDDTKSTSSTAIPSPKLAAAPGWKFKPFRVTVSV